MFKLAACLCFGAMFLTQIILLTVILTTSCIEHKAIRLFTELFKKADEYIEEVNNYQSKRRNHVYDAVKAFDVKTRNDLDEELKRLNGIIDDLKKKSSKCVEKQKSGISNLSVIGRSYTVCSSEIVDSINTEMYNLINRLKYYRDEGQIYDKCTEKESCKELVKSLEGDLKAIHLNVDKYKKMVNHFINKKMMKLEDCSTVLELTIAGEDVIEKINVCAGLNS